MTKLHDYYERPLVNQTIDQGSGLFVWLLPIFLFVVVLCKVDAAVEPRHAPLFDLQDSAFVCVMGVCL